MKLSLWGWVELLKLEVLTLRDTTFVSNRIIHKVFKRVRCFVRTIFSENGVFMKEITGISFKFK